MTWQQDLARERQRDLARLVEVGGSGWHPYALDQAERLERSDAVLHAGAVKAVESAMGPDATTAARRAVAWFRRRP